MLALQVQDKVDQARIDMQNPAAVITRQDMNPDGTLTNEYRQNMKRYRDLSGAEQPKAPATLDELFKPEMLEDEGEEGQDEVPMKDDANAAVDKLKDLQEFEKQRQLDRAKEKLNSDVRKGIAEENIRGAEAFDARLPHLNPMVAITDSAETAMREQRAKDVREIAEFRVRDMISNGELPAAIEDYINSLEGSAHMKKADINELRDVAAMYRYGDEVPKEGPDDRTETEKLYGLPASQKLKVPG